MSASESICAPNGLETPSLRASAPSRPSKATQATRQSAARRTSPCMARKMAGEPEPEAGQGAAVDQREADLPGERLRARAAARSTAGFDGGGRPTTGGGGRVCGGARVVHAGATTQHRCRSPRPGSRSAARPGITGPASDAAPTGPAGRDDAAAAQPACPTTPGGTGTIRRATPAPRGTRHVLLHGSSEQLPNVAVFWRSTPLHSRERPWRAVAHRARPIGSRRHAPLRRAIGWRDHGRPASRASRCDESQLPAPPSDHRRRSIPPISRSTRKGRRLGQLQTFDLVARRTSAASAVEPPRPRSPGVGRLVHLHPEQDADHVPVDGHPSGPTRGRVVAGATPRAGRSPGRAAPVSSNSSRASASSGDLAVVGAAAGEVPESGARVAVRDQGQQDPAGRVGDQPVRPEALDPRRASGSGTVTGLWTERSGSARTGAGRPRTRAVNGISGQLSSSAGPAQSTRSVVPSDLAAQRSRRSHSTS